MMTNERLIKVINSITLRAEVLLLVYDHINLIVKMPFFLIRQAKYMLMIAKGGYSKNFKCHEPKAILVI